MPPIDADETSGIPAMQPPPQEQRTAIGEILRDGRLLAVLITALVGGPTLSGVVTSYAGDKGSEPIQEALDEAHATDARILRALDETTAKLGEVDARVSRVGEQQTVLQISINGDPTSIDKPGIKGLLSQHERKLDSLRKDVVQIKRRDEARDEAQGLDKRLAPRAPLTRDEVWEP